MSAVFTLESLHEELDREYAPLRFQAGNDEYVLRSLLRVDKKVRDEVIERLKALEEAHNGPEEGEDAEAPDEVDEESMLADVEFVLHSITADNKGARLVRALGGDILVVMKLIEKWVEVTQPGEAKDSPTS